MTFFLNLVLQQSYQIAINQCTCHMSSWHKVLVFIFSINISKISQHTASAVPWNIVLTCVSTKPGFGTVKVHLMS